MSATNINASIMRDHYLVHIQAGKHAIIADEPVEVGGADQGPDPYQLLASALGACTCATVRMYADRKGIALDGLKVDITLTRDLEKNTTNIHRDITLMGSLGSDDRDKLLDIANKCPIHKILTNPINIETVLLT
ncbi:MAG: OsmC family peroxiredoxin [Bacteroidetes bacterium]|nr:OsmC family peroxiredoxin [Bacteroidota bacterium]